MKFITIILSLYIFILSAIPCVDIESDTVSHSKVKFSSEKENHSHDKENDLCSPFCVCNCCGQQILNFSQEITFEFRKISTEITTQIPTYKSLLTSNFYGSIWQPPQIA
ncbi:MAG: DUF6660 family protein [Bacteroidota bacterium]